jgi:apolipoprotein N-acyltransferase
MKFPASFPARCLLSVISAAVFAGAFPSLGWRWLVVPGLLGLLIALDGQKGTRARTIGFLHGMTVYALGLSWLMEIFGTLAVMLWAVLAAFTVLFAEFQSRAATRGVTGWKWVVFTALNWTALEFIRAELFPLKFPWMTPGLAVGPNLLLPWIGVYGVGLVVMLSTACLMAKRWKSAVAILSILIACFFLNSRAPKPAKDDVNAVKVAGLQLEGVSLTDYLTGTKSMPDDVDLVVWPEYAVPYDARADKRDWGLIQNLSRERGMTLVFGSKAGDPSSKDWRNIALTIDPSGIRGEHTKAHPVHFFDDGTPGKTSLPVRTTHGKIGTPICFDCDYEGVVRGMTAAGAELIVAPTMDAEKWTARQHDQHAELFRIRACENGRWLFVVATSGVSQIIDPKGQLHARMDALKQGTVQGVMKRETALTFYTRYGWLTPWCALAVAVVCWATLLMNSRSPKTEA